MPTRKAKRAMKLFSSVPRRSRHARPVSAPSVRADTVLDTFDNEFDALLTRMQTTKMRRGMKTAFSASGKELGKAAVAAVRALGK